ncbi:sulfotransferase family protein [Winogradskyella helgolandensis]|uniref:sulfotransferase family protein n=1 Tax=Winogradskyella helgolandensis TaxID=2697010 RepID=UPI0015C6CF39|nr:sulfotransferase [Winogradskyella helgolandensis]
MNSPDINFYCVGAQKAGTTTLHDILIQHPDIYLPETKEAHFFDEDEKYELGFNWYRDAFFPNYNNQKITGSCNPEYMYFEDVPERIFKTLGKDVKLVFIFRNPADRAFSHYLMSKRRCIEEATFSEGVALEAERIQKDYFNKTHFSYTSRGFYAKQVERYLKFFPIENMFFIRFEDDFIKNRKETVDALLKFLEIEHIDLDVNLKSNVARSSKFKFIQSFIYKDNIIKSFFSFFVTQKLKNSIRKSIYNVFMKPEKKSSLDAETRKALLDTYEKDIVRLEKLIGKSLASWRV